jgi:hypothetical protein
MGGEWSPKSCPSLLEFLIHEPPPQHRRGRPPRTRSARAALLNRHGALHGRYRAYGSSANFYVLISIIDLFTFLFTFRTSGVSVLAPDQTPEHIVLAATTSPSAVWARWRQALAHVSNSRWSRSPSSPRSRSTSRLLAVSASIAAHGARTMDRQRGRSCKVSRASSRRPARRTSSSR